MLNENGGDGDLNKQLKTCAVLGGRGFIGRALVERLLRLGNWMVRVADVSKTAEIKPSESLLADAFASRRAAYFRVDVSDKSQIVEVIDGVSVVFYIDHMDPVSQDFYYCYKIIVQGAKNVISACRECRVKRLIYNSSADVIFDDVHDTRGGDESLPYSGQFWDMATDLRTQAEALILFANDIDGLLTCALRPCNVYGPGDKQLLPLLVNMAKSHWDKFIIGSGDKLSDFTYVDNVAHAHICAEESLSSQMVTVSGKAFFITDLEPMKFSEFAFLILESLGYQRAVISIPAWAANRIISLVRLLHVKSDPKNVDPCSFLYKLASRTRTFSCAAAQKHIQYSPIVPVEEAVKLTVDSFSNLAIDSPLMRYKDINGVSKIEKLLGRRQVADILLWRDEKKTFSCFLVLGILYHWFFLSGRTFISSVAQLLLLIVVLLGGHHILPMTGFGNTIPRLPSSCFEISEVDVRNSFFAMKCMLDKVDYITKSLARGEDWSIFFKVATVMYFFKLIVPHYLTLAIGLALILAFSMCFVYEQYEEKIDTVVIVAYTAITKVLTLIATKLPIPFVSGKPSVDKRSIQHSLLDHRQ